MDKPTVDAIHSIVPRLKQSKKNVVSAFLGFDACIDNIVRVVKEKNAGNQISYFTGSRQFGEYLSEHENKSCGIELQTRVSKLGGNMVISANALGNLGVKIDCAGTFGLPDILPFFRSISSNCKLHTIGDTINATALEFNNSKVILFDPGPYNNLTWDSIKEILGLDKIKQLLTGKELISFLNWSEIERSSEIWKGFIDEILPAIKPVSPKRLFFTDFSDCSRKTGEEIRNAIGLLGNFRQYLKVILSLNQNEADLVAAAFNLSHQNQDESFVKSLFSLTNTDILVIHRTEDAIACDGSSPEASKTFFCRQPVILTGGGDNFNAGFCFAQLHGFDLYQSVILANAVSGYYVKTGSSPTVEDLAEFLNQSI